VLQTLGGGRCGAGCGRRRSPRAASTSRKAAAASRGAAAAEQSGSSIEHRCAGAAGNTTPGSILDTPVLGSWILGCKYWFRDIEFSSLLIYRDIVYCSNSIAIGLQNEEQIEIG